MIITVDEWIDTEGLKAGRPPSQATLNRLLKTLDRKLVTLCRSFTDGDFGAVEFGNRMEEELLAAHSRAAFLGRRFAGDLSAFEADDEGFGRLVMAGEQEFLDGFVSELYNRDPRFYKDGQADFAQILHRARMYRGRVEGTAQETWALTFDVS